MGRLEGKTALITGGGRGIGAAIARRFAEEGCRVVVTDINAENAEAVAEEVDGLAYAMDVTDRARVDEVFERVASDPGRLDILVNNAGISGAENTPQEELEEGMQKTLARMQQIMTGAPIEHHSDSTVELEDDEWRTMLDVHVSGTFYCTRAALRIMNRQNAGSIINMGSIMGTTGAPFVPHYCAAKGAILAFTRSVARDVATRGIRVNAIAPGWIETDMMAPMATMRPFLRAQTPLLEHGTPDDIAWAAVYLASEDEAGFVTGQVLSPNGGWYMSQ
jgi:3-oxoacyl-[acyl-carrier protein] reductase